MQDVHLTLPIGTIIRERYVIENLLGKGGYGSVYLVRDKRVNGNLFALKELIDPNKLERDRFTFECEVLRRLDHPALPRVYHAFSDDANIRAYMLMDYIEGANLEVLRQRQPDRRFPLPQTLSIMRPIIGAISYLHNQQPPIIHRDVKPANIIVPSTGDEAVLVDFGIAKEYEPDSTTTTVRRCSPGYGAPEQYSRGTNTRTDIYGLGATIYALLTGVVPADAFYRMIQLGSNAPDSLEPISKLLPSIPKPVADALQCALSININHRFSTVEEFWEALNAYAKSPETTAPTRQAVILSSSASSSSIAEQHETITTASTPLTVAKDKASAANSSHPNELTTVAEARPSPSQPPAQHAARQLPSRPERVPASRTRRIGSVIAIILLLLLIVGGIGAAFELYYIDHPVAGNASLTQAATAGHTQTPQQHSTAAAVARSTTPHNGMYIAGTYNGSMSGEVRDGYQPTILISIVVQQTQGSGNFSGTFTYKSPSQGPYPLTGTIDTQGNFSFTVQLPVGQTPLYFYGAVQPGTYLHGYYCSSSSNHCATNSSYFNVGPRIIG